MEYKKKHTSLVKFQVPSAIARKVAGFRVQDPAVSAALPEAIVQKRMANDAMICLCERVTVGEVRSLIRKGINDLNQIKAITRAGMGPCGAKTCEVMIKSLLREEGIPVSEVVPNTKRPIFVEVPLGTFPDGGNK
ncbi:MAG: (2Fe-2S)-binding protein [Candidatus Cloacimonetes bacterium]|nr:(2Fe-2S)-binding protein [Candidatus Cloacimonadota bacterium]